MKVRPRISHLVVILLPAFMAGAAVKPSHAATGPLVSNLGTMTTGVRTPVRLASDSSGNIYAADPRGGGVLKLNPAGNLLRKYVTPHPAYGVAIRGDGNLIVSQGTSVSIIDSTSGAELAKLGSGAGQFQMAGAIAIGPSSQIYVVDSLANSVTYFSSAGTFINAFGGPGSGPGQFSQPSGISYESASGNLAVVDTLNGRVQFFDGSGVYQRSIGTIGSGAGKFTAPRSVAFEYDGTALSRIYVLDSFQSVAQVLDSSGNPLPLSSSQLYIGGYGKGSGKLVNPSDMLFDNLGSRLVVANSHGNLTLYGINGGSNPVVTVTTQLPQSTSSLSVPIAGTLVEGTTVEVSVDGNVVTTTTAGTNWNATIPLPLNKIYRVTVVATDASGNTTTRYYDIVKAATVTAFDQNAILSMVADGSTVSSQSQSISGTVANGISQVTVAVNGGTAVTVPVVNGSFSLPVILNASSNTIVVTAGGASTTRTVLLDPAAPAVRISAPVDGLFSTVSTIPVNGSSAPGTTVALLVNGSQQAAAWGQNVNLASGLNTIEVVITDPATAKSSREKITVNYNPALGITVSSPSRDLATTVSEATITGTTSAATVIATLYSAAAPNGEELPVETVNGAFTINPSLPIDGTYRLAITTVDASGTSKSTYRNYVRIAANTDFAVTSGSSGAAAISGTSNKPGAVVTLRTASGSDVVAPVFVSNGNTWTISGISGYNPATMFVTAIDAAGNSSRTGRINGSGTGIPDITDAMKALRISARLDAPTDSNLLYGDVAPLVNGVSQPDGRIYIDDVTLIMRRVVGLPWQ